MASCDCATFDDSGMPDFTNNAAISFTIDVTSEEDGSPFGFLGKSLELWIKPFAADGVAPVVQASTTNGMLSILDDETVSVNIPTAVARTIIAGDYVFDLLVVTSSSPPEYQLVMSADLPINEGITERL